MRDINKKFVSEGSSTIGRPKTFTHKWECFEKLRMYERLGTPDEVRKYKEIYDMLEKSVVMEKMKEIFSNHNE